MLTWRSDTLLRHIATHGQRDSQQKVNKRGLRACISCAQAKQRCYGGIPCARCERRGSICEYINEQRLSPASQTDNSLSGSFAEQDPTSSPTPLSTLPASASTSIALHSQALPTISSDHLPALNALGGSLTEGVSNTSWPYSLSIPGSVDIEERDVFADYLLHDMRCADEISRNFGFPFVWTTNSFDNLSWPACTLDQGASNFCVPNDGSLATMKTAGSAGSAGSGPESRTTIDSGEGRTREDLGVTYNPPADICLSFPTLQEDELQRADAQLFGYVSNISGKAYAALRSFYVSERGYDDMSFPSCRLLHVFVELYFEHFDSHLPFLHPMRLGTDDVSWVLLTAVAAIGSQYYDVRDAAKFTAVLQHLLRRATHLSVRLNNLDGVKMADKVGSSQNCQHIGPVNTTECALARCRASFLRLNIGPYRCTAGEKYAYITMSQSDRFC